MKEFVRGANLIGRDLRGADLSGSDLMDADLMDADLRGANLRGADLSGSNLSGANLGGSNLRGAYLVDAVINWQSHDLIAEILWQAAGIDIERRKIAGLVLISRGCWEKSIIDSWAIEELKKFVKDGDNAPNVLRG